MSDSSVCRFLKKRHRNKTFLKVLKRETCFISVYTECLHAFCIYSVSVIHGRAESKTKSIKKIHNKKTTHFMPTITVSRPKKQRVRMLINDHSCQLLSRKCQMINLQVITVVRDSSNSERFTFFLGQ